MDATERARLRELADNATRGPWTWDDFRVPTLSGRAGDHGYEYATEVIEADHYGECGCRSACTLDLNVNADDMAFIAAARTAVPELLDALDAAEARLAAAQETINRYCWDEVDTGDAP